MVDQKLKDYFKFDEADLQANQRGQFSEKQKQQLTSKDASRQTSRRISGIMFLLIAGISLVATLWMLFSSQDISTKLGWIFFGGVLVLLCGGIGFLALRKPSSKRSYKLRKTQGVAKFSRHIENRTGVTITGYWIMHIGTTLFYVSEDTPKFIDAGKAYIAYYYSQDGSSHIISAESAPESKVPQAG